MSEPETPGHEPSQFVALPDRALAVQALRALCFSPSDATRLAAAKLLLEHSAAPVAPVVPLRAAPAADEAPKARDPRALSGEEDLVLAAIERAGVPSGCISLARETGLMADVCEEAANTLAMRGHVQSILTQGHGGKVWPAVWAAVPR